MQILVFACFPFLAGCGGTVSVEGSVTFNDEPVSEGSISFESPDGSTPTFGGKIENGSYRIVDMPSNAAGSRIVRIVASRKTGRKVPAGPPFPPGTMLDEIERTPTHYNDKSTLTAELRKGELNHFDFALKSNPSR